MQSVSWQIEIARLAGSIQVCQGESDSVQLVGGYSAGVVSLIESSQPSMSERTDHESIVPCTGIAINRFDNLSTLTLTPNSCPRERLPAHPDLTHVQYEQMKLISKEIKC